MANLKIQKLATELVTPILEQLEFELVNVEYVKEGSSFCLKVYIDKEGGITIDDCETVSRRLDKLLDEKDPILEPYSLEISSPGLDRQLRKDSDFERFKGRMVDVKLYKQIDKKKEFTGVLVGLIEGAVTIEDENGEELAFLQKDVAIVKLSVIL